MSNLVLNPEDDMIRTMINSHFEKIAVVRKMKVHYSNHKSLLIHPNLKQFIAIHAL